ncbi:MAG: carbonic anhydrase [Burkholderiales bacterium]
MKTIEITYRYGGTAAASRVRPPDAEAARLRLDAGSRAMAALFGELAQGEGAVQRVIPVDPDDLGLGTGRPGGAKQRPFAAVLGCADARVPVELVFNEGPNDLFVVRVAGNGLGSEVLGSLRYAVDHLSDLRLIVVLGHSGCGAVSAAVDVFLDPQGYLKLAANHALRAILDRVLVVVNAAARRLAAVHGAEVARHPQYRTALVEVAVAANAALSAHTLQQHLDQEGHGLRAAYGVYLLDRHEIWAPRHDGAQVDGLAWPPRDEAQFLAFADALVNSARIAALLAPPGA